MLLGVSPELVPKAKYGMGGHFGMFLLLTPND